MDPEGFRSRALDPVGALILDFDPHVLQDGKDSGEG
jgi:hypothetical protein